MEKFKIGVLSDLHFGEFARSIDCCPYPNSSIFEDDYFKIFLEFIKEKEFDINYLVVAGDITEKAKPEEFELASKHITNLLENLDIKKDKVICIPGNHDSDWDAVDDDEEDPTGYKREQRYAPYRYDNWIFNEVSGNKNITKEPFLS